MADLLSILAPVAFFWLALAANFLLLLLQIYYVPTAARPSRTSLLYRSVIVGGFSVAYTITLLSSFGSLVGWYLRVKTQPRRDKIQDWVQEHGLTAGKPADKGQGDAIEEGQDWRGIIGFFHPFWYSTRNPQ